MEFISIKQLQSLSKKISKKVKVGDSIYLYGEIGAGKTTFFSISYTKPSAKI